jgi:isopentenyl phosphate kinase
VVQIVKFGGSVLTEDNEPAVRAKVLERLSREVADHADELAIVHGAGSFGHPLAVEHALAGGVDTDEQRKAMARVHANVRELNLEVLEALNQHAGPSVALSPYGFLSCNDGKPGGWNLVPAHRTRDLGQIPVLFGDLVLDTARGTTVLSGDTIAAELSRFFHAGRVVFALDVDGVFDEHPGEGGTLLETPTREELVAVREAAEETDATGSIGGKIDAALKIARSGSEVALVNGLEPGRVSDALDGDVEGTLVDPEEVAP